jgi:hypothetical protein
MDASYGEVRCPKCSGVFFLRRNARGLVVSSSCFVCGRWVQKRHSRGGFRIFCRECAVAVSRVRVALYAQSHEGVIRARRLRYRLLHPDSPKEEYRRFALREKKYVRRLLDDVIKHPRKYLREL